jgi:hypothetical protein
MIDRKKENNEKPVDTNAMILSGHITLLGQKSLHCGHIQPG